MSILLAVIGGFLFVLGAALLADQNMPPMPQIGALMIFASIGFIIWAVLA